MQVLMLIYVVIIYKNRDFEKVKEILSDEKTYGSGLSEVQIFNISYDLLIESGNCKDALAFLHQMANGISTDEVKYNVYGKLEYSYMFGCKGIDGNKVKKDKKLEKLYTSKRYLFAKK